MQRTEKLCSSPKSSTPLRLHPVRRTIGKSCRRFVGMGKADFAGSIVPPGNEESAKLPPGWKANGKLVQSEIQSCVWELVSDDKDSGCSAGPGARANRHTGGVRSKNTGLIGAKGAFASHVHDGRRGIGFKSVVDASYRGIPESRKRIAALCVRSHTQR